MDDGSFGNWRHICVDMQRLFAEDTPWHVDWMDRILPQVAEIASAFADRTIFTRFLPPSSPEQAAGTWRDYYRKWWMMTGEHLSPELLQLVPELQRLAPPARIFDKPIYSPWLDRRLDAFLRAEGVESLVVTGGETDVCVMATVFGAIDLGYRTVVIRDAVCSGADETHDASLELLGNRFSVQLDLMDTEDFMRLAHG
ncbi:cysteine hydrolase [Rhizobium binxianense]